jgi:hypothetical protein
VTWPFARPIATGALRTMSKVGLDQLSNSKMDPLITVRAVVASTIASGIGCRDDPAHIVPRVPHSVEPSLASVKLCVLCGEIAFAVFLRVRCGLRG